MHSYLYGNYRKNCISRVKRYLVSKVGKKKTSIYVDEDMWKKWMIYVIKEHGSSRKASRVLEDAMTMKIYEWKPLHEIPIEKAWEYIRTSEERNAKLEYEARLVRPGYVMMWYRLRPGEEP